MKPWFFCVLLSTLLPAAAQDLEPELFPLAVKHEQASKTLSEQKEAALARAREPYLKALESAEDFATTAGELPVVAAVNRERSGLSGAVAKEFPDGLPKNLRAARKSFVDAVERVETTYASNRQKIDADYLRSLAGLQSKAAASPKLAEQIAGEKKKLLEGVQAGSGGKVPALPKETLEKELIGHWFWGTEKLWVAITADGKAYLDTKVLAWEVNRDGSVTFTDTADSKAKALCEFDIPDKTFKGTGFDGQPVKGWLKLKK